MVFLLAMGLLISAVSMAQELSEIESIMKLSGATSPDELDAYEMERLAGYLDKPILINSSSLEQLISSGLLTNFQIAVILEYRRTHGDILSFGELAALDGFSQEIVNVLRPFISLKGGSISRNDTSRADVDIVVKGSYKTAFDYGIKLKVESPGRFSLGLSPYSGHVSYTFKKIPLRVVGGDFNARFGQGLILWNGMSMSGLASPSSYVRNQTGVKPSWSFTGSSSMTGVASEVSFGRLMVCGMLILPDCRNGLKSIMPALNASWYGKRYRIGLTHYTELISDKMVSDMKTSVDCCMCIDGVDLFSELAYNWAGVAVSGLTGVRYISGDMTIASMLRYYHPNFSPTWSAAARSLTKCSNECGVSVSGLFYRGRVGDYRKHTFSFSLDGAYLPVPKKDDIRSIHAKMILEWKYMVAECFKIDLRCVERYRTWDLGLRSDFRMDLSYISSLYAITARFNFLKYRKQSFLAYLEGCYTPSKLFSVYLKQGIFIVDKWDDRIYSYERDAPGNYNVPVFYGRGLWTSVTASWKFIRWGKLYARAAFTSYPFMKEEKPGKAELKLQCVISI